MSISSRVGKSKDRTGQVFGRLTVIRRSDKTRVYLLPRKRTIYFWECACSCGNTHTANGNGLLSGGIKSCGCLNVERTKEAHTKHGFCKDARRNGVSPEYSAWIHMIQRCDNHRENSYARYGGRGIKVCKRWRKFENFMKDMGRRPDSSFSLERKNNNLGYAPSNCRWATRSEQQNNRRCTIFIRFEGQKLSLIEWSRKLSIKPGTLRTRLFRGWATRKALMKL